MAKKGKYMIAIKLDGQLYMRKNGTIFMQYGKGGWHKQELGNIKGSKSYKAVMDSYGTKKRSANKKKSGVGNYEIYKIQKINRDVDRNTTKMGNTTFIIWWLLL